MKDRERFVAVRSFVCLSGGYVSSDNFLPDYRGFILVFFSKFLGVSSKLIIILGAGLKRLGSFVRTFTDIYNANCSNYPGEVI